MVADRCWCAAARCEVATPSPALPARGREICTPSPALPTRGRENIATRGREINITGLPTRGREIIPTRGRERYTPSPALPTRGREKYGEWSARSGGLFAGAADRDR